VTRVTVASSVFLANIPSPDRGVWEIGPIPIRAYALCIIAGIILAIWWGERRWIARGGTAGTVIDIAVFAVPFGLVGGRLYHVATDWHRYFGEGKNPLDALRIWDGGLGIWGAIALGAVGALIGCRVKGVPLPAYADAIAPGIVVAQAIGRVGNYFNQELYGGPTDLPWGLELYRRVNEFGENDNLNGVAVNHIATDGSPVHPTFLYELLWNLLVAALVVWVDRKYRLGHGRAFAVYVMGYTLGRTWIELMRTDDATQVFGVRVNVWVSILVFIGAAVYFVLARSRGEREDPSLLHGKDAPPVDEPGDEAKPDTDADSDDADADDADEDAEPEKTAADDDAEPAEKADDDTETEKKADASSKSDS
jgi:prolipoprotein diacylglyceryl transferase